MRRFLFLLIVSPFLLLAQVPDYYIGIDFTKTGQELKDDLSALVIATHSYELFYTPEVWNALKQIDLDPENPQNVLLLYGFDDNSPDNKDHRTRDKDLSCHTSGCNGFWVREHTYPKSLGNPNLGTEGPGSDAHHIRPIDNQKNGSRSNRAFAEGEGTASYITSNGLFYPGDEWRGDVARMMMYMHIRYVNRCPADIVGSGTYTYSIEMPDIFLKWNAEDPVSSQELVRNDVLQNLQGNRNPFIDNPYLATLIWGGPEAENRWPNLNTTEINQKETLIYPNPAKSQVQIKTEKTIKNISLYSIDGSFIFGNKNLSNNTLKVSDLNEGIYVLLIHYTDKSKETKRLILQR